MSDLYVEMMREHPVQKEWMPKHTHLVVDKEPDYDVISVEDGKMTVDFHGMKDVITLCPMEKFYEYWEFRNYLTWLPRQEDWQRVYRKHKGIQSIDIVYSGMTEGLYQLCKHKMVVTEFPTSIPELYTILWCLFVSNEVYGLEWDWKEEKWLMKQN